MSGKALCVVVAMSLPLACGGSTLDAGSDRPQGPLPVDERNLHTHASPRAAVGFLIHAAGLSHDKLGTRINLTMPGVSCTVAEQIEALRRIAGDKVVARIRRKPDPLVMRIVDGWPHRFDAARARSLGFVAEGSFDEIIRIHIEDELGGVIHA